MLKGFDSFFWFALLNLCSQAAIALAVPAHIPDDSVSQVTTGLTTPGGVPVPIINFDPLPFHVNEHNLNLLRGHVLVCDVKHHESHYVGLECNRTIMEEILFVPDIEVLDEPGSFAFLVDLLVCVLCVCVSAVASGLTVGLLALNKTELGILVRVGTPKEKAQAARLMPILERHHLLLCTLLLINATAMETLPLFLDHMVPSTFAIIISVSLILIFGEIIPQALCTRYGLAIGAFMTPFIWVCIFITFPVSYPIGKLLDFLIGEEDPRYRRGELKELIALHAESEMRHGALTESGEPAQPVDPGELGFAGVEIQILQSVLDMRHKNVVRRMTPLEDVFMLSHNAALGPEIIREILERGHSRIPVHLPTDRNNVIGMLLTKNLIGLNTKGPNPPLVSSLELRPIPVVPDTKALLDLLKIFQSGRSHMALVISSDDCVTIRGIITLEDVIEELLQTEILDETDVRSSGASVARPPVKVLLSASPTNLVEGPKGA